MTAKLLDNITLGPVSSYRNLSFVRVFGKDHFQQQVSTLDEVLDTGLFVAEETNNISYLDIQNRLPQWVFIPAGMILEGESQNRASQYPVLVPPESGVMRLPCHCAEEDQKDLLRGAHFGKAETILIANARSGNLHQEGAWSAINATMMALEQPNATRDYASAVRAAKLDDYVDFMGIPADDQLGYVVAVKEKKEIFFYADIFGSHSIYSRLHKMLHQSVAALARQYEKRGSLDINPGSFKALLGTHRDLQWKRQYMDRGFEGELYICVRPVEGCKLSVDSGKEAAQVQVSLRSAISKDDFDPKKMIYFRR